MDYSINALLTWVCVRLSVPLKIIMFDFDDIWLKFPPSQLPGIFSVRFLSCYLFAHSEFPFSLPASHPWSDRKGIEIRSFHSLLPPNVNKSSLKRPWDCVQLLTIRSRNYVGSISGLCNYIKYFKYSIINLPGFETRAVEFVQVFLWKYVLILMPFDWNSIFL